MTTAYPVSLSWQTSAVFKNGAMYVLHGNGTATLNKCTISGLTCTGGWVAQTPLPATSYYGAIAIRSSDNYIYTLRGQINTTTGSMDFWKFDTASNSYVGPAAFTATTAAPAPTQTMTTGADLIWDGNNYVYGLKGGAAANGFWRYNISSNAWEIRNVTNLSARNTDTKSVFVNAGAYNGYIFTIPGGSAQVLAFNTAANDNWVTTIPNAPAAFGAGASLAYPGSGDYIYATRGGGNLDFYAFSMVSGLWTTYNPADLPTGMGVNTGGRLASINGKVYAILGNYNSNFYEYTYALGGGTWAKLARAPFNPTTGSDISSYNNKIYAIAGYYKDKIYEYNGTSWRKLPNIPTYSPTETGPYSGASIVSMGTNGLMLARGNTTAEILTLSIPSTNYLSSASYESPVYDLVYVDSWGNFVTDDSAPNSPVDTEITYETNVSSDGSNWDGWVAVTDQSINSNFHKRYIKVRITLQSKLTRAYTPEVRSYTINYNSDANPPNSVTAGSVVAKSKEVGGTDIASGTSYRYMHPYFSWDAPTDNNESGVMGYYVYYGRDAGGNPSSPTEADASFITTPNYIVNKPMETGNYYLRVKTKDIAGNTSATAVDIFTYNYGGVSPKSTVTKDSEADFNTTGRSIENISVNADGTMKLATKDGFWREDRIPVTPAAVGAGGGMVYKASVNKIYAVGGNGGTTFWELNLNNANLVWAAKTSTGLTAISYGGSILDGPGDYLYVISGNNTQKTYRYDVTNDALGWNDAAIEDTPLTFATVGAAQIVDKDGYIYALRGNTDNAFYRYDPFTTSDGQWLNMANVNFGAPDQTPDNNANVGAALAYDGNDTIYAIQGNYYAGGFAKYSIQNNTWTVLGYLPYSPNYGAALSWDSATQKLFFIPGTGTNKMFSYDNVTTDWTPTNPAPAFFGSIGGSGGTKILNINGELFITRGTGYNSVYKYSTLKNSWYTPTFALFGPNYYYGAGTTGTTLFGVNQGGSLAKDNSGNIYIVRGNYDTNIVKYNPSNGTVTKLKDIPTGVYDGTTITVAGNYLYLVVGTVERALFKYDISNDSWSEQTLDLPPVGLPGTGSSLAYDGSRYIYYIRSGASATWYRYDTDSGTADGARWSAALPVTGLGAYTFGGGTELVYKSGIIYAMRGQTANPNQFFSFDTANMGGSWTTLATVGTAVTTDGFLVDGNDDYLYLSPGGDSNAWWRYKTTAPTGWSQVTTGYFPGQINRGGAGVGMSNKIYALAGSGTNSFSDGVYTYTTQTANSSFQTSGSYISEPIELINIEGRSIYEWGNLSLGITSAPNTDYSVETSTSLDNASWSPFVSASTGIATNTGLKEYVINSPFGRYIKTKVILTSGDNTYSPTIDKVLVNYYKDIVQPTNPTALKFAKSKQVGGDNIQNNSWIKSTEPYFELLTEGESGAATDGSTGSGIDCYYVIFDIDPDATPSTKTTCKTELGYNFSPTEEGETYHLLVQTRDKAGNLQGEIRNLFDYKYDKTGPTIDNDFEISVNPLSYTNIDNYTFTIEPDKISDANANVWKYQYRTGEDSESTWIDFNPVTNSSVTIPNGDHPHGKYRTGVNKFYFKAIDNAKNESAIKEANYFFGATAPSPPQSLTVTPGTPSPQNLFTFEWEAPASYVGDPNKIVYYYSVNAEPTEYNVNMTPANSVGPGAFATQKEENKFYVVAKDEANNIDYKQFASIIFTARTSAPGSPTYVTASDISDKEASQFRIVVSWMAPEIGDPDNFAGYDIYESEAEEGTYTKVANTSGTAYVHTNLIKDSKHYYHVKSIDKTKNESAPSGLTNATASGRYKKAPSIVKEPEAEAKARSATVKWVTSREANSTVEFGTTESFGRTISNPITRYVTNHEVLLTGLNPGTKYYYKAFFMDPDGNPGSTSTGTFLTAPAPVISNLKVSDVTLTSMIIEWDSNVPSYGSILYGKTPAFGYSQVEEKYFTRKHVVKLPDLSSGTDYYIQVNALDEEGNIFNSDQYINSTLPFPKVSNVKFENKKAVESPTVIVTYQTNVETSTVVRYTTEGAKSRESVTSSFTKEHSMELSNLLPQRPYVLTITGRDKHGNEASPEIHNITTLSDTLPPKIEKLIDQKKVIGEGGAAETQLTVKLTTNEESTAIVEAAKGVDASSFNINSNQDGLSRDHTVALKLGEPGIPYSYRVKVKDAAGNETISEVKTLVVSSARKSALEYIVNIFTRNFGWMQTMFGGK